MKLQEFLRSPLFKTALRYGLFAALMTVILLWVFLLMGQNPLFEPNFKVMSIVLMGIFIMVGTKEFKDRRNGGALRFWQGILFGFVVTNVTALLYAIGLLIFLSIHTGVLPEHIELTLEFLKGLPEEMVQERQAYYDEQLAAVPGLSNWDMVLDGFLKKIANGTFLTPIFSVIFRK